MTAMNWMSNDLCELLDQATARAQPDHPFLVEDGAVTTYAELIDRMARLHGLFRTLGLAPAARVGIMSRSAADTSAILLAGLRAGFSMINLNTEFSRKERDLAMRASRLDHVFADYDLVAPSDRPAGIDVTTVLPAAGSVAPRGLVARLRRRREGLAQALEGILRETAPSKPWSMSADPTRTAMMLFTSGTTSNPKVVELSESNLTAQITTFDRIYGYDETCRILNPLPLHFTDGLMHGPLMVFLTGATLFRPRAFDFPKLPSLLDAVAQNGITHFIVVPALLSLMARLGPEHDDAFRTPTFRYIRAGGDRLQEHLWRATQERFGTRVANAYGLSETVCEALYCGPSDDLFKIGTVGKAVDCEVRIVDAEASNCAPGMAGELLIRGTNVMKGYLDQPELTRAAFHEGWFRTGDLAVEDAEGFVTIVGRLKNVIVTGGINVQPQDVVDAMLEHPAVLEAHVIGLPDPDFNEIVACAVVLRDGTVYEPGVEASLTDHCRECLAPQKVPRRMLILSELPRNPAGKVLEKALRELFQYASGDNSSVESAGIETGVLEAAARALNIPAARLRQEATPFNTPGWDSLAHLAIIAAVEQRFDIHIEAREVLGVESLADLSEIVMRKRIVNRPGFGGG